LLVQDDDQVFGNLGCFVKIEFQMQIIRDTGTANFCQEVRYAVKIALLDPRRAAELGQDPEIDVGLGGIFEEMRSCIVPEVGTRSGCLV
jgi:hypothetical protein